MIKFKTFLLLFTVPTLTFCQNNWQKVGTFGTSFQVRTLYSDVTTNLLYIGGAFVYADSVQVNGIARWNGIQWDSVGHGAPISVVYRMVNYNNYLYASGNFCNDFNRYLSRWNGTAWDTCFAITGATMYKEHNSELYVGGGFQNVDIIPANGLAKFDGANWTIINNLGWINYGIFGLEFYNGELYCGGNFFDTANGISRLAKFDGSNFSSVENGIVGAFAYVSDMAVYQNELIIAGGFSTSQGNAGNGIIKWNGTNLSPVGTGLGTIYTINDIEVYGGYLYAAGDFDSIDGVSANRIARWDGASWTALGPELFDNGIGSIAFYQNQLYAGGGFWTIDGDSMNYIAKYTGPLSVKENANDVTYSMFPNPVSDNLTIEFSSLNSETKYLSIYNMLGAKVLHESFSSQKYSVNVSSLATGIYIAEIGNEKNILRKKFVKK